MNICDRCKREIPNGRYFHVETSLLLEHDSWNEPEYRRRESLNPEIKLCRDCIEEIERFIKFPEKFRSTQQGGKRIPQLENIDIGKVMALRTANPPWSLEKIADEFGTSISTIHRAIKEWEKTQKGNRFLS